jgi:hypothetical protein
MSEEQSEIRKKEIEDMLAKEEQIAKEMETDACPHCGKLTKTFQYLVFMPSPFGWLECPGCGMVFCPASLRKTKLNNMKRAQEIDIIKGG